MSSAFAFTNTPTFETNGGKFRIISRAPSKEICRRLSLKNMNPTACAPASTATVASASFVIPQILILTDMDKTAPTPANAVPNATSAVPSRQTAHLLQQLQNLIPQLHK